MPCVRTNGDDDLFLINENPERSLALKEAAIAQTPDPAHIAQRIAERRTSRKEALHEAECAQVTLNSINDGVLSTDNWGNVTYLNAAAEKLTGWPANEALGRPLAEVFQILDAATHERCLNLAELIMRQDENLTLTANCVLLRRDELQHEIEKSTAPIYDRNDRIIGAVIVFHDLRNAKKMVLQMAHLAHHDPLTSLPNRLLLSDRITQAISMAQRSGSQLAVIFLDLDGFKEINDSLGHAIGDRLLQSVATRISRCVRKSDTVSRQGGDEFIVLLSEVAHAGDAEIIAAKILAELLPAHRIDEHSLYVTASIGVSTYPYNGEDAGTLLKNADRAMYKAKACGRNNYRFFHKAMGLRASERQSLEARLRCALDRDELALHYQPKVNLATGAMTGSEALLRWHHPELGLLSPGRFLDVAEKSGLLVPIGKWAIREACRQTRAWLNASVPALPVSINISSLEFRNEGFLECVRSAISDHRVAPDYLQLECTETVLMRHPESSARVIDELKNIGVRVLLDHFGTGYSSLSYLTRFAVDGLKLDPTFLGDIGPGTDGVHIMSALIGVGRSLSYRVIAQGVERVEQLECVRKHGCEEAQGYYWDAPMTAPQFENLLVAGVYQHLLPIHEAFAMPAEPEETTGG